MIYVAMFLHLHMVNPMVWLVADHSPPPSNETLRITIPQARELTPEITAAGGVGGQATTRKLVERAGTESPRP